MDEVNARLVRRLVTYSAVGVAVAAGAVAFMPEPGTSVPARDALTMVDECPFEDSTDCVWFASERGNGDGMDFYAWPDGAVSYMDEGLTAYKDESGSVWILPRKEW